MQNHQSIHFDVSKDPVISILLIAIHTLAILTIWPIAIPFWIKILASMAMIYSCGFYLFRYGLKYSIRSVTALEYDGLQNLSCKINQQFRPVKIHWRSVTTRWLMALDCIDKETDQHYKVLVWSLRCDKVIYRQLSLLLKLNRGL